jgi:hypothetical protein
MIARRCDRGGPNRLLPAHAAMLNAMGKRKRLHPQKKQGSYNKQSATVKQH